jgi:VCBS repeat-containing protein
MGLALIMLWGCGASVDGGGGRVFEGSDLATTVSLDQNSAQAGTNVVMTAEITNSGTDSSGAGSASLTLDGWPLLITAEFDQVQFLCAVDGGGSCDNARLEDGVVRADLSLDAGATATLTGRLPVVYSADSDDDTASLELCADVDPNGAEDTNPDNNCASAEVSVSAGQEIIEFRDEVIYWAMTDRFFNGDPANDNGNGDREGDTADPDNPRGWHGGDFAGIKAKIEEGYFQAMGFTAIWISPVVYQVPAIDSGDFASYHGYWLENYDDPEPHFGSWQELNDLVATAHANDLKILIDLVVNHAGYNAQLVDTEPDWFRTGPECGTNEERITQCLSGLPDTRQEVEAARQWALDGARNILLQSGADGFRIDTYKHVNEDFWYDFYAPGGPGDRSTVWSIGEYFDSSSERMAEALDRDGSPSVFDFPLYGAITSALATRSQGADAIANVFENDTVYEDPTRLTTFVDNHDVVRFMTQAIDAGATETEAEERLNMALGLMYASRGVPSVYYGTEIAMQGAEDPDNRRTMVFPENQAAVAKTRSGFFRKATCGVTGSGDPAEAYGAGFFIRGSFDGWADPPNDTTAFANLGGNDYQAEFEVVAGTYDFKVASADWSTVDFTADGAIALDAATTLLPGSGLANTTIEITDDGCYNFQLDVTDPDAPVLTVTQVAIDGPKTECGVTGTGDPAEAYGAEFFIRGSFDGWADPPSEETAFANMGNNIYEAEFETVAGSYDFKMASADWSTVDFTADGAIALDQSVTLLPGSGLANTTIEIPEDGCYNFQSDVTETGAPTLVVTVVEIDDGGGTEPPPEESDVDLVERLTRLAAARADYPALRRGSQEVAYSPASACEPEETGNDPAEAFGVEMFARGSFNGWADPPPPGDAFANLGGGVYEARVQLAEGEQAYKVASADWSSQWSYQDGTTALEEEVVMANADGEDTNGALTIDEAGCYTWTMDASDTSAPTLTVSQLFAGTGTDVVAIQRDMDGEASVVAVTNNEDEDVDLSTLPGGGIPVDGLAGGAVVEITGAETDLSVAGGVLTGTVPARTTYLVSDQ